MYMMLYTYVLYSVGREFIKFMRVIGSVFTLGHSAFDLPLVPEGIDFNPLHGRSAVTYSYRNCSETYHELPFTSGTSFTLTQ